MSAYRLKAVVLERMPEPPLLAQADITASKARTEMIIVRVENRHIPMTVKTGYCRSRFEGYLGNVG
jgi:hypothetical protein